MGVTYEEKRNELMNFLYAFKSELCCDGGIISKGNILRISDNKYTAFVKVESTNFTIENEKEIRIYGPAIVCDVKDNMAFKSCFDAVLDITDSEINVVLCTKSETIDELSRIVKNGVEYIFDI